MIKEEYIGAVLYAKNLDMNITIHDVPALYDMYKRCGFTYIFKEEVSKKK